MIKWILTAYYSLIFLAFTLDSDRRYFLPRLCCYLPSAINRNSWRWSSLMQEYAIALALAALLGIVWHKFVADVADI
jgi:hypothetical protein